MPAAPQVDVLSLLTPNLTNRYTVGELLGKGSFGHVYAAKDKKTGAPVALKIMIRSQLGPKGEQSVRGEIEVMTTLQHPMILKLHTTALDNKTITLVLDQVQGGEVFQQLLKIKHYSERVACKIVKNLLIGVKYMHDEGFVHRDLKPDNMLLTEDPRTNPDISNIRIADFGFATKYRGVPLTQPCGTPYYIAPEILDVGLHKTRPHYGETVDLWSAGVIAYLLLSGYPPFNGSDKSKLFKAISRGVVDFNHAPWRDISYEAKDFLLRILQVNPAKRLTATTALQHKWLKDVEASPDVHLEETHNGIKRFNAKEKMKAAVFGAEAVFRLQYLASCDKHQVKPNSVLVEMLTAATEPIKRIDMANNYLGPKGIKTLVSVLSAHSEVEVLILRNSLITDELAVDLLNFVATSSCKVRRIAFDNNPITHATGRRILAILQAHRFLDVVTLAGTHVSESIQRKVSRQCEVNLKRPANRAPVREQARQLQQNVALAHATPDRRSGTAPTIAHAKAGSPQRPMSGQPRKYDAVTLPPLVRKVARTQPSASPPRYDPSKR